MVKCAPNFAYANEEESFCLLETTCGKLKKLTVNDRMFTIGPVDFSQEQEFIPDEQIKATASQMSPIKGRKMPGESSFTTYVKPYGPPRGTAPEHDVLFRCLMGDKSVTPNVSVVYTLANQLDSFSFWTKKGHTVFAFRGCGVESADFNIVGNEIATIAWSIKYMEQMWAGTINATNIAGATITLPSGGAQLYSIGDPNNPQTMYVTVGDQTNGGNGFAITAVNYTNDTLMVNPAVPGGVVGVEVAPWWPTAVAEVGVPIHGKMGVVNLGGAACAATGADAVMLGATVSMVNGLKYYIGEKNNEWVAKRFGRPKIREITGNLSAYFMERGPSYFYRAEYQQEDQLIIPAGNVAAYIMELCIPYAEYKTPKVGGDEEFTQDIPFVAITQTAGGNDEFRITFK